MAGVVTASNSAPPRIADTAPPPWTTELVALDLDGTCLDGGLKLHPRIRDAVHVAARRLPVVIATGRMFTSTLPWARRLGVTEPLICYQGALVRHQPGSDVAAAVIAEFPLDGATAQHVVAVARRNGWHRQAYSNDELLCEEDRPEGRLYGNIAQVHVNYVDDLDAAVAAGSTKIVCVVESEDEAVVCEAAMRGALGASARVTRSLPQFVEITNTEATKGAGLGRLCSYLGVDIGHAVAIGDAPNDTDMLAAVGFGIAVEGARDDVMRAARATCTSPAQAGVADVIEWLGLVS